jgi:hypothetical protein
LKIDKPNNDTRLLTAESYLKGYSDEFYQTIAVNEPLTSDLIANLSKRAEIEKILGSDILEFQILSWVTQSILENTRLKKVEGFRLN